MDFSMKTHAVRPGDGEIADVGPIQMRVLAAGPAAADSAFTLAEFTGAAGSWTVPHIHQAMEESFFVLDGEFTFTVGEEEALLGSGAYILVPRGTRHMIRAGSSGGRLLALMVPGGLERMFVELAELPPGALTDPAARAAVSARHDSVPVP
jgi:quercetin dioxygenase-like cupin family protein